MFIRKELNYKAFTFTIILYNSHFSSTLTLFFTKFLYQFQLFPHLGLERIVQAWQMRPARHHVCFSLPLCTLLKTTKHACIPCYS